jgi:hypothetical protein
LLIFFPFFKKYSKVFPPLADTSIKFNNGGSNARVDEVRGNFVKGNDYRDQQKAIDEGHRMV